MDLRNKKIFILLGVVMILLNLNYCSRYGTTIKRITEDTSGRYIEGETVPMRIVELDKTRKIIVLSDFHRGDGGRADYFKKNKDLLNKILKKKFEDGFTLVLTGDIEEAWAWGFSLKHGHFSHSAKSMNELLDAYTRKSSDEEFDIFDWEKLFHKHKENRYYRIYGNHDDYWKKCRNVNQTRMGEMGMEVYPAVKFVDKKNKKIEILVIHGCQGQPLSDIGDSIAPIYKAVELKWYYLRSYFLKEGQRLRPKKLNAVRQKLAKQEKYMIKWAEEENVILVAGHTHRPYFMSEPNSCILERELKNIKSKQEKLKKDLAILRAAIPKDFEAMKLDINKRDMYIRHKKTHIDNKKSEKEFIEAEIAKMGKQKPARTLALKEGEEDDSGKRYFNTGCCFAENIITAIEIEYKDEVKNDEKRGWYITLVGWLLEDKDGNDIVISQVENIEDLRREYGKGRIEDIIK